MFRLIVLWQFKEGTDTQPIIRALEELPAKVPSIRRAEVNGDLGLTKQYGCNGDLAWIAEFDDQSGWEAYAASPPHDEFRAMCEGHITQFLVNMWSA